MQHCKRHSVPIIWDQSTYLTAGRIENWESQARFGYRTGICLALHMPEGRHFVLGVDRDQALPTDGRKSRGCVADLQLFAVHAQDTAMRVLVPERLQPERPKLSPRELDGLRWTMEGKTAWESAPSRHHRAHGGPAHQQRHAQAQLHQQAPGGAEGAAPGPDPLAGFAPPASRGSPCKSYQYPRNAGPA
jgi:hypothetical protein